MYTSPPFLVRSSLHIALPGYYPRSIFYELVDGLFDKPFHNSEWAYTPRKLTEYLQEEGMKHRVGENAMTLPVPFAGEYAYGIFHIFLRACVAWLGGITPSRGMAYY